MNAISSPDMMTAMMTLTTDPMTGLWIWTAPDLTRATSVMAKLGRLPIGLQPRGPPWLGFPCKAKLANHATALPLLVKPLPMLDKSS